MTMFGSIVQDVYESTTDFLFSVDPVEQVGVFQREFDDVQMEMEGVPQMMADGCLLLSG